MKQRIGRSAWPAALGWLALACGSGEVPAGQVSAVPAPSAATTEFGHAVESLSEPGGYFDTDNLISNESSYLHVAGALRHADLSEGAYIGVGPDQNFSYIALVRPAMAYLIDLRRDNLLQHLLFKALFEEGRNRVEFLSLLYGRPPPEPLEAWDDLSVQEVTAWVDGTAATPTSAGQAKRRVRERVAGFGVALYEDDWTTLETIHEAFIEPGLDLRFTTFGRAPRFFYPTHRDLLLAEDLDGRPSSYVVREEDYQFLRTLHQGDAIIPVVGDLAGDHALQAVGRDIEERGLRLSAMYVSNVEFYLFRNGSFGRFAETVSQLPTRPDGVLIRSYFGGEFRGGHPQQQPGFYSAQLLHRFEDFDRVAQGDGFRDYDDLVTRSPVRLRLETPASRP